jgi:hypothetical protein
MSKKGFRPDAEPPDPPDAGGERRGAGLDEFRWEAFFQRAREPLFLLNHRCRLLFVNEAWERLTGMLCAAARGLSCRRPRPPRDDDDWEDVLGHVHCPPPETLAGQSSRARRRIPPGNPPSGRAACWWDVEFIALHGDDGILGFLGTITPLPAAAATPVPLVSEALLALREQQARRYGWEHLTQRLPALRRVVEQVRLASQVTAPVLLVGDPGTGKDWLARTIHYQGASREGAFAALDCRRLPAAAVGHVLFREGPAG